MSAGTISSALPDFAIAGYFGITWLVPDAFGTGVFARLEHIMLMEFIIVHSSAFLAFAMTAPKRRTTRVLSVIGLGLFYTLFVGSFALSFGSLSPLVSFWMLLLNRILSVLFGPTPQEGNLDFIVVGWATAVAAYLGFVFLTSVASLPRLGVSVAAQAAEPVPGGGLWAAEPWRLIAFGTFYYATMGITELFGVGTPSQEVAPSQGAQRYSSWPRNS
jgi:hypothetical protein